MNDSKKIKKVVKLLGLEESTPTTENDSITYDLVDDNGFGRVYVKLESTDGGTINKSKTVKMDASANSNGANLKWGTVNSKNPYIGYAADHVDGTCVV